jgi:ribonuclease BN (tRNA processing enzyme)
MVERMMIKSGFALATVSALLVSQPALAEDNCPKLRWTTLGTAGGPVPTEDRAEPSNLLDAGTQVILVDTGDGTANQLARIGRDVGEVHSIFLSHLHWDHAGGLGAVIGLRWMNTYPGTLRIYGPPGTEQLVQGILASLRPSERVGFGTGARVADPKANIQIIELKGGEKLSLGGLDVRNVINNHFDGAPSSNGTISLSYRFSLGNRSITYTGDTGPDDAVTALATGSDMLVSEVIALDPLVKEITSRRPDMSDETKLNMRQHLATHHIDAEIVGKMAAKANVQHLVMTHFAIPGPLRRNEAYLRDGARRHYSGSIDLARDLSSFDVGCRNQN